jgi:hypothetical protein
VSSFKAPYTDIGRSDACANSSYLSVTISFYQLRSDACANSSYLSVTISFYQLRSDACANSSPLKGASAMPSTMPGPGARPSSAIPASTTGTAPGAGAWCAGMLAGVRDPGVPGGLGLRSAKRG